MKSRIMGAICTFAVSRGILSRRNFNRGVVVLALCFLGLAAIDLCLPKHADAAIVVGHDINTLGTFVAGTQEETFAVNLAEFLTADSATKELLLFESRPGDGSRDFSTGVVNALLGAGFLVTVTPDYTTEFDIFDAVFVAEDYPSIGFLDNAALINYARTGGGVYLAGGVDINATREAAGWAAFLNHFGLAFESSGYNGLTSVTIDSDHAIFDGVSALGSGNGQSILDLGTNPNAQIVQLAGGQGVYAVVDTIPIPPAFWLFGSGLLGLVAVARRKNAA